MASPMRRHLVVAAAAALVAALALLGSEAMRPLFPGVDDVACDTGASYMVNTFDLVKFLAIGVALLAIRASAALRLGRAARAIGMAAASGAFLTGLANTVEHCAHVTALGVLFALGLLVSTLGTIVFGVLAGRAKAPTATIGWFVAAAGLGYLLFAQGSGKLASAAAWTVVAVLAASRARRET